MQRMQVALLRNCARNCIPRPVHFSNVDARPKTDNINGHTPLGAYSGEPFWLRGTSQGGRKKD